MLLLGAMRRPGLPAASAKERHQGEGSATRQIVRVSRHRFHGDPMRFLVMAEFLAGRFPEARYVADVAGGQGMLSRLLQKRHNIESEVMTAASALATATRSTLFTVMLSAFYVLAHKITGSTDLAIRAFTAGRDELQFQNTMGLFLNCVPFRTDIAACMSFRDIVMATRETFVDAMAYELPVNVIEQAFPGFVKSRENLRTSQFIISNMIGQLGDDLTFPIAECARWINDLTLQGEEVHDIPSGMVWNLTAKPAGPLNADVLFNLDEFDENTVAGWTADLRRILASAVRDPDQDWKHL